MKWKYLYNLQLFYHKSHVIELAEVTTNGKIVNENIPYVQSLTLSRYAEQ